MFIKKIWTRLYSDRLSILYTVLWVSFVFLLTFGGVALEFISPRESGNVYKSLRAVFLVEFSSWATFLAMVSIWFFLMFDYLINNHSGKVRDHKNRICYPAHIMYAGIGTIIIATAIFVCTANRFHGNLFDFHTCFRDLRLQVAFFVVYLLLILYIRYVTVHETKVTTNIIEPISREREDKMDWTEQ